MSVIDNAIDYFGYLMDNYIIIEVQLMMLFVAVFTAPLIYSDLKTRTVTDTSLARAFIVLALIFIFFIINYEIDLVMYVLPMISILIVFVFKMWQPADRILFIPLIALASIVGIDGWFIMAVLPILICQIARLLKIEGSKIPMIPILVLTWFLAVIWACISWHFIT